MSKSIAFTAALAFAALLALPAGQNRAVAQSSGLTVVAVDLDIVPGRVDAYLAAVKENGAAAVKEPGCREFNISVSDKDPNHVLLFEVYDNPAALEAHRATEHFKAYAAAVKELVAKRDIRIFTSAAMNAKGK
jgi:quinol monooxygenase YgiN